jgi:kynureninase
VSFSHPDGYPVMRALIDHGVHGDFRAPDLLRFGFAPLCLRYADVYDAVTVMSDVLGREVWREGKYTRRLPVT